MPQFTNRYEVRQSPVTGLFVHRPMLSVTLYCLADANVVACHPRMRLDTGANISCLPFSLAADVLGMPWAPVVQLRQALLSEMQKQGLNMIQLRSASGSSNAAYPVWLRTEIEDDQGEVGSFQSLIAFVEGQHPGSLLAGLTGFLDKFDIQLLARNFQLSARPNSGVTCPFASKPPA